MFSLDARRATQYSDSEFAADDDDPLGSGRADYCYQFIGCTFHPSPADIHTPENCLKFTGQALPLRQRRFWCPRNSRGEITICPAKWPRRCPQPRSVRVQSTGTINPRPGHVRVQSMTASASAVFPSARTLQIRAQSVSLGSPRPRSGREPAVSRNLDRPGNVRAAASSFPV